MFRSSRKHSGYWRDKQLRDFLVTDQPCAFSFLAGRAGR
jgi:hypothetical protein